ncbi:MAG: ATP-binding protein, partial [Elusimicrobia bacterium]|nr:ATP-binding protein [Elusimicrobiota bacterium]
MNPFKYGRVVSGQDFCPRPELNKQLTEFIESGQNAMLEGERRMGKTSLVCEVIRRIKRRRMLYVDLLEIKTADDLCKRMVKAIISMERQAGFLEKALGSLSQLRPVVSADPLTGQPTISLDAAVRMKPDSIDGLLDLIQGAHKRTPLTVVFDEFQDILNLPDAKETLAVLRSKIQFHEDIPYIFAGSVRNQMKEIFTHPQSAFFKSAVPVEVGPLNAAVFTRFLTDKFALGKRVIDAAVIAKVIEVAENVPGDAQELCAALWETTSYRDAVKEANLAAALETIYAREAKGYETMLVQLTGQQLKCLIGLARLGGKAPQSAAFIQGAGLSLPASSKKALDRLGRLKIIYRHQGEYKFI